MQLEVIRLAELEKVIRGLEICIRVQDNEKCPDECPYRKDICYGTVGLMADALSLLKAQEPVAPEEYTVIVSQYGNAEHKCYRCGACKCGLIRNTNWRQKYCPECGRAVKWPELPKEGNT